MVPMVQLHHPLSQLWMKRSLFEAVLEGEVSEMKDMIVVIYSWVGLRQLFQIL